MNVKADLIRRERMRRGWTQQQLAEISGLSLRTVQRVEGQGSASQETISSLAAVLEVPRDDILPLDPASPNFQRAAHRQTLVNGGSLLTGMLLGALLYRLASSLLGA